MFPPERVALAVEMFEYTSLGVAKPYCGCCCYYCCCNTKK